MAIQGGFDYSVSLIENYVDAYVGTWAANLNTNGFGMELDYYGGFTGAVPIPTIEDYFSYDIGMLYYDYPGLYLKRMMMQLVVLELKVWNF